MALGHVHIVHGTRQASSGYVSSLFGAGREQGHSFFFQAEDGIRDADVTGVQTCALPISPVRGGRLRHGLGAVGHDCAGTLDGGGAVGGGPAGAGARGLDAAAGAADLAGGLLGGGAATDRADQLAAALGEVVELLAGLVAQLARAGGTLL